MERRVLKCVSSSVAENSLNRIGVQSVPFRTVSLWKTSRPPMFGQLRFSFSSQNNSYYSGCQISDDTSELWSLVSNFSSIFPSKNERRPMRVSNFPIRV